MIRILDPKERIRVVRNDDPDFQISAGLIRSPRAAIEIMENCPDSYRYMLIEAVNRGWIQPVAYLTEKESVWEKLQK